MLRKSSAAAAALAFLFATALLGEARAACVPKTGVRGTFPHPGDSDIPTTGRFLFEVASWPAEATVEFEFYYGTDLLPGKFSKLFPVGPVGAPHSQYLYEFKPDGGIAGGQVYHSFLISTLAGATKTDKLSLVFTAKLENDLTPPTFGGIVDLTTIHGSPDSASMESGYDCILDEGTFTIAGVKFPTSEVKIISDKETRRDGVIFTAYEIDDAGQVGKVLSRSMVWPAQYTNTPVDWKFVVEKDPVPDTKRCYVVRATDAVGNEDTNMNVKCITAPGPASLPPGAGAPGFFGDAHTPGVCGYGAARPGSPGVTIGLVAVSLLVRRSRRR